MESINNESGRSCQVTWTPSRKGAKGRRISVCAYLTGTLSVCRLRQPALDICEISLLAAPPTCTSIIYLIHRLQFDKFKFSSRLLTSFPNFHVQLLLLSLCSSSQLTCSREISQKHLRLAYSHMHTFTFFVDKPVFSSMLLTLGRVSIMQDISFFFIFTTVLVVLFPFGISVTPNMYSSPELSVFLFCDTLLTVLA